MATLHTTYVCVVCGFVYDEAAGRPEDGIAPGTAWADVPADWCCPASSIATCTTPRPA